MSKRHYSQVREYESVLVAKPTLSEEEYKTLLKDIKDFISKKGGEVIEEQDWGTRALEYRISGFNHGKYYFYKIRSENPNLPNELDFNYKINDNIIRWLNIKVEG